MRASIWDTFIGTPESQRIQVSPSIAHDTSYTHVVTNGITHHESVLLYVIFPSNWASIS